MLAVFDEGSVRLLLVFLVKRETHTIDLCKRKRSCAPDFSQIRPLGAAYAQRIR
jgi:hypothetical protein